MSAFQIEGFAPDLDALAGMFATAVAHDIAQGVAVALETGAEFVGNFALGVA